MPFTYNSFISAIKNPKLYFSNSHSQSGEDAIIKYLLFNKKEKTINYLDVGTNHPTIGNNTYLFYKKGFKGICIEADKTLIPIIKKFRPKDIVLNLGVSVDSEKEAPFYIFNESGLNTFDKFEAEKRIKSGKYQIKEITNVPLISINNIISKYFSPYPTYLSLDIEGLDLAVLESIDFNLYPIPIICVETCTYSEDHKKPKDERIQGYLNSNNYFIYADTYINTIFVNKDWFYNTNK